MLFHTFVERTMNDTLEEYQGIVCIESMKDGNITNLHVDDDIDGKDEEFIGLVKNIDEMSSRSSIEINAKKKLTHGEQAFNQNIVSSQEVYVVNPFKYFVLIIR